MQWIWEMRADDVLDALETVAELSPLVFAPPIYLKNVSKLSIRLELEEGQVLEIPPHTGVRLSLRCGELTRAVTLKTLLELGLLVAEKVVEMPEGAWKPSSPLA